MALSVFQQFVGINVIFYYSNVLWEAVGFDESQSFVITVITSVTNIATTLIAIALIDKVGRKPLLLIGSVGMAVTLGTMAIVFGTAPRGRRRAEHLPGAAGPIALIAANLFVVFFGMSWGPVVWVLLGEMFPNRMRAAALGLAAAGAVGGQLDHHGDLPGPERHLAGSAPTASTPCSPCCRSFRLAIRRGDQGHAAGGHAPRRSPRAHATLTWLAAKPA